MAQQKNFLRSHRYKILSLVAFALGLLLMTLDFVSGLDAVVRGGTMSFGSPMLIAGIVLFVIGVFFWYYKEKK